MSTEEQLQLAISQNVELRAVIARLEAQLDPGREERLRQMYQDEARRTEDFYRKMMDDMREEHARDMDRLAKTLTESHELQVKQLKDMIASLQASLQGSRSRENLARGKRFGRKSEKGDNLVKVIIRYPEKIEEHIYETATVRSADAEDYCTASRLDLDLPCPGCCFSTDMLTYIIAEKYCYNNPFDQIVAQLQNQGFNISKSTLGDDIHRVISWVRTHMTAVWEAAIRKARNWQLDETPLLVGCGNRKEGDWSYLKKYVWAIRATILKLVWFVYEQGSRGKKAIEPFLKAFIGFYTTDGYVVYKVFDDPSGGGPRRSACLVHIRRCFVDAIGEDRDAAMWFIDEIGKVFSIEYHCKKMGMSANERLVERLKIGSTADILAGIEARLKMYETTGYDECGALMTKALKYARSEWPAMKRVLENAF